METKETYRGITYTFQEEENRFKGKVDLDILCQEISRDSEYELKLALKENIDEFHKEHTDLTAHKETSHVKFLILAAVGLIWLGWLWVYFPDQLPKEPPANTGNSSTVDFAWLNAFSPYFNNLGTPVIALLSYMGLLYTLFQQTKAHKLSLEELELTRLELKHSSDAQKAQATALDKQNKEIQQTAKREKFDSTFYSLLDKHNEILKSVEESELQLKPHLFDINEHYQQIHKSLNHCRYFRVLYQLLKFIAVEFSNEIELNDDLFASGVTKEEKSYASFVRSMLSDQTLYLLAVNGYCPKGIEDPYFDYKRLITRYQFLEHLTFSEPLEIQPYRNSAKNHCAVLAEYEREAFGRNVHLVELEDKFSRFSDSMQLKEYHHAGFTPPTFEAVPEFDVPEIAVIEHSDEGAITSKEALQQISEYLLRSNSSFIRTWFRYISKEKNSAIKHLISILTKDEIDKIIDGNEKLKLGVTST